MKFDLDNFKKSIKEMTIKVGFKIIDQNPEKNVDRLFQLTEKIGKDEFTKDKIRSVKEYYDEIPSIKEYVQDILKNTDKNCLKNFYSDFIGNAMWYGIHKRKKSET